MAPKNSKSLSDALKTLSIKEPVPAIPTLKAIQFPTLTEPFSFLYDLLDQIGNQQPVNIREINFAGGRYTGKTFSVITFLILLV